MIAHISCYCVKYYGEGNKKAVLDMFNEKHKICSFVDYTGEFTAIIFENRIVGSIYNKK